MRHGTFLPSRRPYWRKASTDRTKGHYCRNDHNPCAPVEIIPFVTVQFQATSINNNKLVCITVSKPWEILPLVPLRQPIHHYHKHQPLHSSTSLIHKLHDKEYENPSLHPLSRT